MNEIYGYCGWDFGGALNNRFHRGEDVRIDRMIRIYGFEHPLVIQFAELCERMADTEYNNNALKLLMEAHEEYPVF